MLSGLLLAILAHLLIGISLVWDKVLLERKETRKLIPYVFWLGAITIFGLVLTPFGFKPPPFRLAALSFTAGLLDLIASFFLLLRSQVWRSVRRTRRHGWVRAGDYGLNFDPIAQRADWRRRTRICPDERGRICDVLYREVAIQKNFAEDSNSRRRIRLDEYPAKDCVQPDQLCERICLVYIGNFHRVDGITCSAILAKRNPPGIREGATKE